LWSLVFYLSLEKVWNYKLLATPWYHAQPLLVRLVTMQVRGHQGSSALVIHVDTIAADATPYGKCS
jgi:hypothetical protein